MRLAAAIACALLVALCGTARADDDPFDFEWSTLYDGGAVPFVYGTGAVAVGAFTLLDPADEPRLFSEDEGGATRFESSIPDYQVGVLGLATTAGVGAVAGKARWFHVKGMLQSFLTTSALTEVTKVAFGRHRPSFDPAISDADDRKSFFSGHSSLTFASMTYLGLVMHDHGPRSWRVRAPAYAGMVALAVYVPYTRIDEHKHHVSDVLTGTAVGTAMSVGFYWYQQRRFERASVRWGEGGAAVVVAPWGARGIQVVGRF